MPDLSRLIDDLSLPDAPRRAAAAEELARLEQDARGAAVPLVRATADEDEAVREWVVGALEAIGPPSRGDRQALANLLASESSDVAYWSATLLGRLEQDGAPAVPALAAALKQSQHRAVRERAAWALGQIAVPQPEAMAALRAAAESEEPRLARLAQAALTRLAGG